MWGDNLDRGRRIQTAIQIIVALVIGGIISAATVWTALRWSEIEKNRQEQFSSSPY